MFTLNLARSPEAAVDQAAEAIIGQLANAISLRGQATLVVSGGQSPIPLLERLNIAPLPWQKITVTLADERWVDSHHENSNERLVHTHLLKNRAESACFIPLKNEAGTPRQGARLTEQALKVLPNELDMVVLGMGMDGHTLSWFPDAPQLETAMKPDGRQRCSDIVSPAALHPRLTLTYRWIKEAREIVLFLGSEEKTRRFQDLVAQKSELPIMRLVNSPQLDVQVFGVEKV